MPRARSSLAGAAAWWQQNAVTADQGLTLFHVCFCLHQADVAAAMAPPPSLVDSLGSSGVPTGPRATAAAAAAAMAALGLAAWQFSSARESRRLLRGVRSELFVSQSATEEVAGALEVKLCQSEARREDAEVALVEAQAAVKVEHERLLDTQQLLANPNSKAGSVTTSRLEEQLADAETALSEARLSAVYNTARLSEELKESKRLMSETEQDVTAAKAAVEVSAAELSEGKRMLAASEQRTAEAEDALADAEAAVKVEHERILDAQQLLTNANAKTGSVTTARLEEQLADAETALSEARLSAVYNTARLSEELKVSEQRAAEAEGALADAETALSEATLSAVYNTARLSEELKVSEQRAAEAEGALEAANTAAQATADDRIAQMNARVAEAEARAEAFEVRASEAEHSLADGQAASEALAADLETRLDELEQLNASSEEEAERATERATAELSQRVTEQQQQLGEATERADAAKRAEKMAEKALAIATADAEGAKGKLAVLKEQLSRDQRVLEDAQKVAEETATLAAECKVELVERHQQLTLAEARARAAETALGDSDREAESCEFESAMQEEIDGAAVADLKAKLTAALARAEEAERARAGAEANARADEAERALSGVQSGEAGSQSLESTTAASPTTMGGGKMMNGEV